MAADDDLLLVRLPWAPENRLNPSYRRWHR